MKQNKKKSREFKRRLFYKNKMCFIASVIMTIVMSFLNLMISWLIQQIMDSMANQNMQSVVRCATVPRLCIFAADTEKFALFFKGRNRTLRFCVDK